jgi:tRNA 2-selenouridine synthase
MKYNNPTPADLEQFDEIIDVRSPAEFAEDHIPGARNCPVLDNQQRIEVGTCYKQVSAFEAKKIGAAMIAENISKHLRAHFLDRPKSWKPLIYCWRGGDRSASMTTIFRAIGWPAGQLGGGYKTYRSHVVSQLEILPPKFNFHVVCGATGSAKTRVLQAIGELGEQILDLESLASHKGSVLGILPGQPQPSQKWFETLLLQALNALDPARPVYVEAESRKIGNLHLPAALITQIRGGICLGIEATLPARVAFLLEDYAYFLADPSLFLSRIDALKSLQSRATLDSWRALALAGEWATLVQALLEKHYDPLYQGSQHRNFAGYCPQENFPADDLSESAIVALAERLIHSRRAQIA